MPSRPAGRDNLARPRPKTPSSHLPGPRLLDSPGDPGTCRFTRQLHSRCTVGKKTRVSQLSHSVHSQRPRTWNTGPSLCIPDRPREEVDGNGWGFLQSVCTSQSHMLPFGILCIEHIDQCFANYGVVSAQAKTAPSLFVFFPPHTSSSALSKSHPTWKNNLATWTRQLACALLSIWGFLINSFLPLCTCPRCKPPQPTNTSLTSTSAQPFSVRPLHCPQVDETSNAVIRTRHVHCCVNG